MITELSARGHDAERVRIELAFLTREECLVAEHLRSDKIDDGDLLKISAAGVVHLQLMANPEYLAACAEDTWIADEKVCKQIADRICKVPEVHFSMATTALNAKDFVDYLNNRLTESLTVPEKFLQSIASTDYDLLREARAGIAAIEGDLPVRLFIGGVSYNATEKELKSVFADSGIIVKKISLPKDESKLKCRGYAFIEIDKLDALAAFKLDGVLFCCGRRLHISEARDAYVESNKPNFKTLVEPALNCRVYISNLPYSYSEMDIRKLLARNNLAVVDIYLALKMTGCSKGYCFVEFSSPDLSARACAILNGYKAEGRILVVKPADPKAVRIHDK